MKTTLDVLFLQIFSSEYSAETPKRFHQEEGGSGERKAESLSAGTEMSTLGTRTAAHPCRYGWLFQSGTQHFPCSISPSLSLLAEMTAIQATTAIYSEFQDYMTVFAKSNK